ncbi:hypothetical protein GT022_08800 [Agaribacter marinus]|uniref:Dynamin family protein n=1 Tax=Virgibacillus salarius TaxID=447199 RepID=A0A941DVA2_9BACI|nr:dynamin family protein [Virgibacillus salarius]MBR7796147.1 dynamin family protein [Virgibacillus salarius]NAZ08855.1 hypothetical protein [Agaribacter marinus]
MSSLKTIDATQRSLYQLAAIYQKMIEHKDVHHAEKILELYDKFKKQELMICFAGHFSAGKSSMINALLKQDILPKSPIPTSANIVKIESGNGTVRLHFHHDAPEEYQEPFDMELIKQYSMDKDKIKKIEISTSEQLLPNGTALIDTPGIDAADDADRLMTESSLHLIDVLFYVMDYNHVQSEVNLQFLAGLHEKSIPFYVIINQIDKHDENELSFQSFETSIKQTFDLWDIQPIAIFYSSLVESTAQNNQFEDIKHTLHSLLTIKKGELLQHNHAAHVLVKEHETFLELQYEEKLAPYRVPPEHQQEVKKIKQIEQKITNLQQNIKHVKRDFFDELHQTLKNAYLMPANLRDSAKLFLESQQSHFKIGLIGSKKKTEEARQQRATDFLSNLEKVESASLQWKLRDKWSELLQRYQIEDTDLQEQLQHFSISLTYKDLVNLIKQGATINGDYVINYTNDLSGEIKRKYKQQANQLWNTMETHLHQHNTETINACNKQLNELKETQSIVANYVIIEEDLEKKKMAVHHLLKADHKSECAVKEIEDRLLMKEQRIKRGKKPLLEICEQKPEREEEKADNENTGMNKSMDSMDTMIQALSQSSAAIQGLPGFDSLVNDLQQKKQRLQHRSYTIALFGAFSAGKSSFANALIGEQVLPVSPNPTTATVNRINPVTDTYKHGTVLVKVKDEASLIKDIHSITKKFSPKATKLEELLEWIRAEELFNNELLSNTYQSYLKAMLTGFNDIQSTIGEKLTLSIDEFPIYVTDESKACYLESIDLYYDCELTRQGISLVDTPGADSVNARHTNVAFDYIKHADAILYVTYYNHALNRADKDFLMQLGRVKEVFQLDKMFFIVNAADLAKDEQELQVVCSYVKEQLLKLGIRFPRLYPASSRQSLQEKQAHIQLNEKMNHFEAAFYHFIHDDLTHLTVASALWDMKRAYQQLNHYIESQKLDQSEKAAWKQSMLAKKDRLQHEMKHININPDTNKINQKIEKQLYYVLERIGIRFHDMFKEMFNPTTITETGKYAKMQLWDSLQNLITYCGQELIRELQAVSLRIESLVEKLAKEVFATIRKTGKGIDDSFILPNIEIKELVTPTYLEAFSDIDVQEFERALATFKNTKSFFEKNEKELMKDEIYRVFKPFIKQYLEASKQVMVSSYSEQWAEIIDLMKKQLFLQWDNYMNSSLEMMTSNISLAELKNTKQKLASILELFETREG